MSFHVFVETSLSSPRKKSASMQKRTSPLKFGDLVEKSELNSVSNLSTKCAAGCVQPAGCAAGCVLLAASKLKDPTPH